MPESEKNVDKKINSLLKSLEKDYSVTRASDIVKEPKIRTNVYALDYVLDGGVPQKMGGCCIEFLGAESSAKSTFALHVVKKFQELGKTCVYIDAEHSYDPIWADVIGVKNESMLTVSPTSLEDMGDLIIKLIPETDLIVIDSITAVIPMDEIDRETGEPTMALQARVNALIVRKIYHTISKHKTVIIFINQIREKVGVMYGNPITTSGGHAIKHLYSARIEFKQGKPIEVGTGESKERVGTEINLHCIKNKVGCPNKKSTVDFMYDGSLDNAKSLFFSALKYNIIKREGNTYTFGKLKAVGQEKFEELLTPEILVELEKEIWALKK